MKPIAIVLGGTSPHKLLIDKLKSRGFYVILVDFMENPPAKATADEHIMASTLDKETVLFIARERKVQLVISTCIDQANSICCYVAEQLNLPHPYSYQTSLEVTHKGLMKRILTDNKIPTSPFVTMSSICDQDLSAVGFPAVVKPVDCNSSKGVKRVDCEKEAAEAIEEALHLSRTGFAILEGYNVGPEIQVDCLATSSGVKVMMTRQKQKLVARGNEMVLQSYGSIFPAQLNTKQETEVQCIADGIASAFNLRNTPFFYQAIVTEFGIKVLEFAPRIGGGLSYSILKNFGSYDAVEYAIDSFLGVELSAEPSIPTNRFLSSNIIYVTQGTFDHIEGLEELKAGNVVDEYFNLKVKGDYIDGDMRSSNRVAAFIVEGNDYSELMGKERRAFAAIDVYDIYGKSIFDRSIYPIV